MPRVYIFRQWWLLGQWRPNLGPRARQGPAMPVDGCSCRVVPTPNAETCSSVSVPADGAAWRGATGSGRMAAAEVQLPSSDSPRGGGCRWGFYSQIRPSDSITKKRIEISTIGVGTAS